jgi:negative regulator of sigma E activity
MQVSTRDGCRYTFVNAVTTSNLEGYVLLIDKDGIVIASFNGDTVTGLWKTDELS